jgi:ankyrin repeat protein
MVWSNGDHSSRRLLEAVQSGDIAAVRALLDGGADVNGRVVGDGTPLIVAARHGNEPLVRLLIDVARTSTSLRAVMAIH